MLGTPERMKAVSVDLNYLERAYFYIDEPVNYVLQNKTSIQIYPISLKESEIFLSSVGLLKIDKNSTPSVEIIQMSYLQFVVDVLLKQDEDNKQRFLNLLILCLHQKDLMIFRNDKGKPFLANKDFSIIITHIDFEDIKRIILYQNILHYDDEYINPELKRSMVEMDELRTKGMEIPTLERKIAIITSHTGLSKKEQLEMTYRSHELLFQEVCGEVDFITIRPVAIYCGKGQEIGHWVYKRKTGKFDNYITNVDDYTKKMGNSVIKQNNNSNIGENYDKQFMNFNK